jgi:hypothetical protein
MVLLLVVRIIILLLVFIFVLRFGVAVEYSRLSRPSGSVR